MQSNHSTVNSQSNNDQMIQFNTGKYVPNMLLKPSQQILIFS